MYRKVLPYFVLICLLACNSNNENVFEDEVENPEPIQEFYFPPVNSDNWETISIEDLGWNINAMTDLESFLINSGTEAFLIIKNGRIAIENYYNGFSKDERHPWFSAGKTLTAFTVGLAQQDGFLSINDKTSDYLGSGWTNMTSEKEDLITIWHQLTMSSGGDYRQGNLHCTDPSCLDYFADAGDSWYYHNAFYTLIQLVLDQAIPQGFDSYFNQNLRLKIGMTGFWVQNGYNRFYASDARSMARFGILNLREGNWDGTQLLNSTYFEEMVNTSQDLNKSYGYLWWLNGKESAIVPGSPFAFPGELVPNAPVDMIAGLGANDQKLYVIPSENMVVVRLGDDAGTSSLGPSSFDNQLWEKINALIQ